MNKPLAAMADDTVRELCCLVEDDPVVFAVSVSVTDSVMYLKRLIQKEQEISIFRDLDPMFLSCGRCAMFKANINHAADRFLVS